MDWIGGFAALQAPLLASATIATIANLIAGARSTTATQTTKAIDFGSMMRAIYVILLLLLPLLVRALAYLKLTERL